MTSPPNPGPVVLTYVEHPEVTEIFVDAMDSLTFDGVVRIEFVVNRLDGAPTGFQQTGKKHAACRLVLSVHGLPYMVNQLTNLMETLVRQGTMQKVPLMPMMDSRKPN